jgi:arylsulfatase A-like enzyme
MKTTYQLMVGALARVLVSIVILLACALRLFAQDGRGPALPPATDPPFKGTIGLTLKDSTPSWPALYSAPKGAPNVLVVLLDDVGFGNTSAFGGPVQTPTLDSLAQSGLRYNNFHVTALCSPTRAALLTGRNHHEAGTGVVTETSSGYPGYQGFIPKSTATIAEILKLNGYNTAAFGKWHNVPVWENSPAGPFEHWATGIGFEYFYGFVGGMTEQYSPNLFEGTTPIEPYLTDKQYYLNTDLANKAIQWVRNQHSVAPQRPFFIYFAPGAGHAPHQVPKTWIEKYQGRFDKGWNEYRDETFARQKKLGIIPADAKLAPWPNNIPQWASLRPDQQRLYAHQMEVDAGFVTETDTEIGRLVQTFKELGVLGNTLVIYIAGDNGASPEGGLDGTANEDKFLNAIPDPIAQQQQNSAQLGGANAFNNYSVGWAWASNTPFKGTKQNAAYLGGITDGLVISWPNRIKDVGRVRPQFHHVIDVSPTILEAAGIPEPSMVNGVAQKPISGTSMVYTFDNPNAPSRHTTQYFEMLGNMAIYHDGWMASCYEYVPWAYPGRKPPGNPVDCKWELYNLNKDYSQTDDLASDYPDTVHALKDLFWEQAAVNSVLPVNNHGLVGGLQFQAPTYLDGRNHLTFYHGMVRLPETSAPNIMNKSFKIRAVVDMPNRPVDGMLVTEGGRFGGYGLFIQNDKLVFVYNFANENRYVITSNEVVPTGRVTLGFDFTSDGGRGPGGTGNLFINGNPVGEGRIAHTESYMFSDDETFDVGMDTGTPVIETYQVPFALDAKIETIDVDLGEPTTKRQESSPSKVEQ